VLGGYEKRYVRRFKGRFEKLDKSTILEFKIRPESGLADRARCVNRGQEAYLVVSLCGVPLSEAINVNEACVAETFAGSDHGIFWSVFFVKAHVTNRLIPHHLGNGTFFLR